MLERLHYILPAAAVFAAILSLLRRVGFTWS
jgi:hypothetical protein